MYVHFYLAFCDLSLLPNYIPITVALTHIFYLYNYLYSMYICTVYFYTIDAEVFGI